MQNNCNAEKIRNFICDGLSRNRRRTMMMMTLVMSLDAKREKSILFLLLSPPHNASHDLFSGLTLRSRCACITARDARQNKVKQQYLRFQKEKKKIFRHIYMQSIKIVFYLVHYSFSSTSHKS